MGYPETFQTLSLSHTMPTISPISKVFIWGKGYSMTPEALRGGGLGSRGGEDNGEADLVAQRDKTLKIYCSSQSLKADILSTSI